ncbi:MAG: hypothetical protein IJA60_04680, partial [Clostridia bacterium]|nr:hypothetical protein [Clostridia bacterium]
KTAISPEDILDIPNKVGTYTKKVSLDDDLAVLVKHKVITTPEYWKQNSGKLQYLPELIHNMSEVLR